MRDNAKLEKITEERDALIHEIDIMQMHHREEQEKTLAKMTKLIDDQRQNLITIKDLKDAKRNIEDQVENKRGYLALRKVYKGCARNV